MRILFVGSDIPSAMHTHAGAVSIVGREAMDAFLHKGHSVTFQAVLGSERRDDAARREGADLESLERAGVAALDPLVWSAGGAPSPTRPRRSDRFYPMTGFAPAVAERVTHGRFDLVFSFWSPEALAATADVSSAPVFTYYGNPDAKPGAARLAHAELFDLDTSSPWGRLRLLRAQAENRSLARAHLRMMSHSTWAANVCKIDAEYYAAAGHPRAFYVQNMWADIGGKDWQALRDAHERDDAPIIGSIGNISSTGNRFGLLFLADELMPQLERELGGRMIDVLGIGDPGSLLRSKLTHPSVRMRGWVDDIDQEILSSPVFLNVNNNCADFIVGHTRFLHAWSLGACVVAHENSALAMPEIVHNENALLGGTGEEIAAHVVSAIEDADLRRRIGAGGRATFERDFRATTVIERVLARIAQDL